MSAAINTDDASKSLPLVPGSSPDDEKPVPDTPLVEAHTEQQAMLISEETLLLGQASQGRTHSSSPTNGRNSVVLISFQRIRDTLDHFRHTHNFRLATNLAVAVSDPESTNASDTTSRDSVSANSKSIQVKRNRRVTEYEINRQASKVNETKWTSSVVLTKKNKIAPSLHDVVLMLLALTHLALWATVITLNLPQLVNSNWLNMLRLVRTPLLLVTWFYLLGVNMAVWTAFNVNYMSLFGLPRSVLTPAYIFGAGGIMTALIAVLLSAFMFLVPAVANDGQGGDMVLGLLLWALVILFIFNPLGILCRRERFTFLGSLGRSVMSPFFSVSFFDAWFADQLVSLVIIMLDLEYLVCYWIRSVADYDTGMCTSNVYYIRTVITVLPTTWRYLQCLRSYVDTKDTKHLWNAMKYFTNYPVVFFATIYVPKSGNAMLWLFSFSEFDFDLDDGIIFVLWAISAFVNAMYSFVWDVVFDWNLCSFHNKRLIFRRQRIYRPTCWYGLALVTDFVLRFLWTVKISLAVLYHQNVDLVFTALTFAEVFRRFFWNFIRVEIQWIRTT